MLSLKNNSTHNNTATIATAAKTTRIKKSKNINKKEKKKTLPLLYLRDICLPPSGHHLLHPVESDCDPRHHRLVLIRGGGERGPVKAVAKIVVDPVGVQGRSDKKRTFGAILCRDTLSLHSE